MKKLFLALVAAMVCLSTFAQAPQGGGRREFKPEDMATRQADRIKTTCETNDKQYKALYEYFLRQAKTQQAEFAKMRENMNREAPSEEEMAARRAEWEKRQKAQNDTIKSILTADQFAKYEKMQKEMRQRGPGQGGPRQGGPRPQGGQPGGNR